MQFKSGLYFQCQGSGQCCTTHGEFGFVFLTRKDRQLLAQYLKIPTRNFTQKYCDKNDNGYFHLKERPENPDCLFLKKKKCSVYSARPTQCRTWPFWPEVMNPKSWKKEIVEFCPGVNKGRFWTAKEIEKQKNLQLQAEKTLAREAQ